MNRTVNRIKGFSFAAVYVGVYYAVAAVVYYLFYFWNKMSGATVVEIENSVAENLYLMNILVALVSLIIYQIIGKLRKKQLSTVIKRERCLPIIYFMTVSLAIGCRLLVSVYYFLSQKIEVLEQSIDNAVTMVPQSSQLFTALLCAVVVAPWFEEILFRGLVMGELLKVVRPWVAITLQAIVFGVAHGVLFQFLYAFVIGIILGIVYYRTKSINSVILCHMMFNISAVFTQEEYSLRGMLICVLFGLLLCVLSVFYILLNSKKDSRY